LQQKVKELEKIIALTDDIRGHPDAPLDERLQKYRELVLDLTGYLRRE
jgi:hypothetical protein